MSALSDDASAGLRKTAWLYRHLGAVMVGLFLVAAIGAGVLLYVHHAPMRTLRVDDHTFKLDVADNQQAAALGLGDRQSLPKNRGMLFILDSNNSSCFWMKDMNFPLDIIWFNATKKVVHIEKSVSPDTYPHSFCPSQPAKYVIELNAGISQWLDIQEGQTLQF